MLKVKLYPRGKKHQITYRIVISEARSKSNGKFVDDLGFYTPQTKTLEETVTSLTSASLADGESWYFHVRSVDIAGNWDDDFATIGPFFIAATPPPAPANPTVDAGNATATLRWKKALSTRP